MTSVHNEASISFKPQNHPPTSLTSEMGLVQYETP
jgi:hypothetical protein